VEHRCSNECSTVSSIVLYISVLADECLRTRRGGGNVLHIADNKETLELYCIADSEVLNSSHVIKRGNQFPFIKVRSITGARLRSQAVELTMWDSCQSQSPEGTRPICPGVVHLPACHVCVWEDDCRYSIVNVRALGRVVRWYHISAYV
jgi:hypothetical protein